MPGRDGRPGISGLVGPRGFPGPKGDRGSSLTLTEARQQRTTTPQPQICTPGLPGKDGQNGRPGQDGLNGEKV